MAKHQRSVDADAHLLGQPLDSYFWTHPHALSVSGQSLPPARAQFLQQRLERHLGLSVAEAAQVECVGAERLAPPSETDEQATNRMHAAIHELVRRVAREHAATSDRADVLLVTHAQAVRAALLVRADKASIHVCQLSV